MTTKFNMTRDINGYNGFGLQFTDLSYSVILSPAVNTTLIVPSVSGMGGNGLSYTSQWLAIFSYSLGNVWVALNSSASVPVGGSFSTTNAELLPSARLVNGGDVLNFITDDASVQVNVMFYSLS